MQTFMMEWDSSDLRGAIKAGFNYVESKDEIVISVFANPHVLQKIVFALPDEVLFDYIPDGIGFIRTAYLKRRPLKDDEIRFLNQDNTVELRLILV